MTIRSGRAGRRPGFVIAAVIAGAAVLVATVSAVVGLSARVPGEEEVAPGVRRNQALHIAMPDGTRLAVDLWLPADFDPETTRAPTLLHMTRYWRARQVGPLQRLLIGLKLADGREVLDLPTEVFNAAGYAVIHVDARGTGASFGVRDAELSPQEFEDYRHVVDWAIAQPWSNGRVGAYGVSYNGDTAERLAALNHPAVRAVAPLYADFDFQLGVLQPGGATLDYVGLWGAHVRALDDNAPCRAFDIRGPRCLIARLMSPGVKRVDADRDGALLRAAVAQHARNHDVGAAFSKVEFVDDVYGDSGLSLAQLNAYGYRREIAASAVPMQVWAGWMDAATVDGVIGRFLSLSNPQDVIIGPFSHGGQEDTDPFAPTDRPVSPSSRAQYQHIARFFDRHLKSDAPATTPERGRITYYTFGSGEWCRTDVWPPRDLSSRRYWFGPDASLTDQPPVAPSGRDSYTVDPDHSTGPSNRWFTNLGYGDVVYADRRPQDARLLTYTGAPLTTDLVITGAPILTLTLQTSRPDMVLHAYLEAVAPDGRSTYLSEGVLRAIHPETAPEAAPYPTTGVPRSHRRADARPAPVGAPVEMRLHILPTSVAVPAGSRIRIAIGGADTSIFPRPSGAEPTRWTVLRDARRASYVDLPVRGACERADPFAAER